MATTETEMRTRKNGERQFILFMLVVLIVLTAVLNIQVFVRNDDLDDIHHEIDRIGHIADQVTTPDPAQQKALQNLIAQVEAIYKKVVEDAGSTSP